MGGLFSYFKGLIGSKEMRILILGLDGAGIILQFFVSFPEHVVNMLWKGRGRGSVRFPEKILSHYE